ncbi:uncharacterized protein LOC110974244 isoform X2 [Acanthaster planci]|uniref:Uncharacterized protein LOC110974244 isoform X2 n=1 Tax=Acanthaster planci TaxID=133434 RepID=A0A8B7XMP6_ACAPL|nr:uncharacterized protein LOC110974244 isoform X2 [Acanthaster planci]
MNSVVRKLFRLLVVIVAWYSSLHLSGCVLREAPRTPTHPPTIVTFRLPDGIPASDATDDYLIDYEKFEFHQGFSSTRADCIRPFDPVSSTSNQQPTTDQLQDVICDAPQLLNVYLMDSDVQAEVINPLTWCLVTVAFIGIASWAFSPHSHRQVSRPHGDFKIHKPSRYVLRSSPKSASLQPHVLRHRVAYLMMSLVSGASLGIWWIYNCPSINPYQFGASYLNLWTAPPLTLADSVLEQALEISDRLRSIAISEGFFYFVAAVVLCFCYLLVFVSLSLLLQPPKRRYQLTTSRAKCRVKWTGLTFMEIATSAGRGMGATLTHACHDVGRQDRSTHKPNNDSKNELVEKTQDQKFLLPKDDALVYNTQIDPHVEHANNDGTENKATVKVSSKKVSPKPRGDAFCQPNETRAAKQSKGLTESSNHQPEDQILAEKLDLQHSELLGHSGDHTVDRHNQQAVKDIEKQTVRQKPVTILTTGNSANITEEDCVRVKESTTPSAEAPTQAIDPEFLGKSFEEISDSRREDNRSQLSWSYKLQHQASTEPNINCHLEIKGPGQLKRTEQEETKQALGTQLQLDGQNIRDDGHKQPGSPRKSLFQRTAEVQLRIQASREGRIDQQRQKQLQLKKVGNESQKKSKKQEDLHRQAGVCEQAHLNRQDLNISGCFRFNAWSHPELPTLDNFVTFYAEQKRKEKAVQSQSSPEANNEKMQHRISGQQIGLKTRRKWSQDNDLKGPDIDKQGCLHFSSWHSRRLPAVVNILTVLPQRYAELRMKSKSNFEAQREILNRMQAEQQLQRGREPRDQTETKRLGHLKPEVKGHPHQDGRHQQTDLLKRHAEFGDKTWFQRLAEAQQRLATKTQHEKEATFQRLTKRPCLHQLKQPRARNAEQTGVRRSEDLQQERQAERRHHTDSGEPVEQRNGGILQQSEELKPEQKLDQRDQGLGKAFQPPSHSGSKPDIRARRLSVRFANDASLKETAFIVENPSQEIVSHSVIKPENVTTKSGSSRVLRGILADARRKRRSCPRRWIELPPLPGGPYAAEQRAIAAAMDAERCRALALELEKENAAVDHRQVEPLKTARYPRRVYNEAFKITGKQLYREEQES